MADELYPTIRKFEKLEDEDVIQASNKIVYYKDKMDKVKIDNVLEKCAEYWSGRANYEEFSNTPGPIYLDASSRTKLNECLNSVKRNKQIQALLHPKDFFEEPIVMNEATLVMDVKVTIDNNSIILKLKSKIDNFTFDRNSLSLTLNDLKTTGHYLTKFEESFKQYRYYRQMGMYSWMLTQYIRKEYSKIPITNRANMLVVSTVPQYYSGVYKVKNSDIRDGFKEFIKLLKMVAYCEVYGYNRETDLSRIV